MLGQSRERTELMDFTAIQATQLAIPSAVTAEEPALKHVMMATLLAMTAAREPVPSRQVIVEREDLRHLLILVILSVEMAKR